MTFASRSYEMLPSTIFIMWPMQLQSLKLLHPTVYVTYAATKYEVAASNGLCDHV